MPGVIRVAHFTRLVRLVRFTRQHMVQCTTLEDQQPSRAATLGSIASTTRESSAAPTFRLTLVHRNIRG